ncbi:gliding motility-associated-like protein [Filimonas zeae]|uniref:PKD domain-containing protein n=1 Tax=Filimonas zeae TaxID=1737353 RepID=A0A917J020_9BACT|nr:gliding motility-associated C-terminal domain-containing protein [Filimonas zeae]MDR6338726.1 gliding motility-associated-like protein [Filimonas zeae]GGH66881.1 hypothetical protein GCM10011379_21520 [Filimonas zeae]
MNQKVIRFLSKCLVVLLACAATLFQPVQAQTDFPVGTGAVGNTATSYPCPLPGAMEGSRAQYLFRAAELQAAGLSRGFISGLKINVLSLNDCGYLQDYSIKMGATTVSTLSATTWEPTPQQYYHNEGFAPEAGVNTFTFNDNFFWDGTSNILVEICLNGGNRFWDNQTFNPTVAWTTGLAFNASHTRAANNTFNFCTISSTTEAGTATTRPNLTFTWQTAPPDCSGTPAAGTASASKTTVCPEEPFLLSYTGTPAMGLSYQWQSSTNGTTWQNIAGATKDTVTTSLSSNTHYRLLVTCVASSQSVTSSEVLVSRAAGVSGNFTINNSLTAPGAGEFASFADAYNHIKCGVNGPVVFNVVNTGTPYNEQLIINKVPGTSTGNTITFKGNGATITYLSTVTEQRAVIKLNGASHITFDSLVIEATAANFGEYGYGVHLTNNADSNTIRKCTITANTAAQNSDCNGIVISGGEYPTAYGSYCDGNTIEGNTISGGNYGITVVGGTTDWSDFPVNRNKILNNTIKDFYEYGIYMTNTLLTTISGNDISRPNRIGSPAAVYGIYITQANMGTAISGNRIHAIFNNHLENADVSFYGISLSNADADAGLEHQVNNNLIYDIKGLGTIYALHNFGTNFVNYYHNTISLDDHSSASIKTAYGFYTDFAPSGINLYNNLFSITRGGAGLKYGMYFADKDYAIFQVDNNNYFFDANPTVLLGYINDKEYATLADWKTASTFDANAVMVDPAFKNAAAGDFTPTSVLFDNKGKPVTEVPKDIYNTARSATTPDIGAVEFTLPACNTSFVPGESYANVGTTACVNKEVLLNLKNNAVGLGMTYQWQSATDPSGTWTNLSTAQQAPPYRFNLSNSTLYYRAAVSCNGGTPAYSTPVQIVSGGLFPAGTYTIDRTRVTDPAGTRNFQSFTDVEKTISCGITGPVVFNVKDDTYREHVRFANIPNSSAVNTITFQSESGNAAAAVLVYNAASVPENYTIKLDSASHFVFRNLTIASENNLYGRVVDILNTAADIKVLGCIIKAPLPSEVEYATWGYDQTMVTGIHAATGFKGGELVINNNQFHGGAKGIYLVASASRPSDKDSIANNTFDSCYHHSIYAQHTANLKVLNNTVPVNTGYSAFYSNQGVYGIYTNNCDGALEVSGNNVTLQNNVGYMYGIYLTGNNGTATARGKIASNTVMARDGLTSHVAGIHNQNATYQDVINNEISVQSSIDGTINYEYAVGLFSGDAAYCNYYNNSILNTSPAAGMYNVALYADHQSAREGGFTNMFNNVFANTGGGPAVYYSYTAEHINSDYNLLYTPGNLLVKQGPEYTTFEKDFSNLAEWRAQWGTEMNSLVYAPAFTSNTNLRPNAADAHSWAMQGRGMQQPGNVTDKTGNARSQTLTGGVPDLGAYEFTPTVAPPALTALPAAPVAGGRQVFMLGTDTVTTVQWGATVPATITLQRYSGILPAGLPATEKSMYYYVAATTTGAGNYQYSAEHHFIDPWLNTLPIKSQIKLGRTNSADVWAASAASVIDSLNNIIKEADLNYIGRFTGMTDGKEPQKPVITSPADSTNKGTRFWAPYGLTSSQYLSNGQEFKFLLAADETAQVTVSVNGTAYRKTYTVPAGTILTTDALPKSGAWDARLRGEGLFDRGILIESDKPISATAFIDVLGTYGLLMPAGTYSKSYIALGARQFSGYSGVTMGRSWVNVVADRDSTVVEITPSNNTEGGRAAGVPFRVTLQRGQVYQVIGAFIRSYTQAETGGMFNEDSYAAYDLTGTKVVSVPNVAGICQPIAVFSGSSATGITCKPLLHGADASMYQQAYPAQAWGTRYLTTPLATQNSNTEYLFNTFRVLVKDVNTVVKRNGVIMTGRTGNFYEFSSRDAEYIEADRPIMVGQYMTYFDACGNDEYDNPGSNECMAYLTPLGYGIKESVFFTKKKNYGFEQNVKTYLNVIVPQGGFASLKVDGVHDFDLNYPHPQLPGYTVAVKMFEDVETIAHVTCDSAFTALVHIPNNIYGLVNNAGFRVPRVSFEPTTYRNVHSQLAEPNTYTCVNTTFKPKVYLPVTAASLTFGFSRVTGVTPATDITVSNPVATDTIIRDNRVFYGYLLNQEISFAQTGTYSIPLTASYSEDPATCNANAIDSFTVAVIAAPVVDYTTDYTGCINATGNFTGSGTAGNGAILNRWNWNFGDNSTAATQTTTKQYSTAGTYTVALTATANDGCTGNTSKQITVIPLPVIEVVNNNIGTCPGSAVTFEIKNPETGVVYTWYNQATNGTLLQTGNSFTTTVASATQFYVSASRSGCNTSARLAVTAYIIPDVAAPIVTADSVGTHAVRFSWNAVTNATGYQISTDNGTTWTNPSSGVTGLTHTIGGLQPKQQVTLLVRSLGGCQLRVSQLTAATTLSDAVFVPNSFSPNGDGVNDVIHVYGADIKSLRFMIFNQWGQKVFETSNKGEGWDGRYGGKMQPSGVYIYVCSIQLNNGGEVTKKGSVNLIR